LCFATRNRRKKRRAPVDFVFALSRAHGCASEALPHGCGYNHGLYSLTCKSYPYLFYPESLRKRLISHIHVVGIRTLLACFRISLRFSLSSKSPHATSCREGVFPHNDLLSIQEFQR
jgi:hypothetical protein